MPALSHRKSGKRWCDWQKRWRRSSEPYGPHDRSILPVDPCGLRGGQHRCPGGWRRTAHDPGPDGGGHSAGGRARDQQIAEHLGDGLCGADISARGANRSEGVRRPCGGCVHRLLAGSDGGSACRFEFSVGLCPAAADRDGILFPARPQDERSRSPRPIGTLGPDAGLRGDWAFTMAFSVPAPDRS